MPAVGRRSSWLEAVAVFAASSRDEDEAGGDGDAGGESAPGEEIVGLGLACCGHTWTAIS